MTSSLISGFPNVEFLTESLCRFYEQLMPVAYDESKYLVQKLHAALVLKSHILTSSLPRIILDEGI